jgi:phytoene desaturase
VAPEGCENLFLLIPVAPGLQDSPEIRDQYFDLILERLERLTEQSIRPHITYKRAYAHRDFVQDYHAFKGNAYGLANTLLQTAFLKPKLKSRKVSNLYYTGQLTVPGPGVPPSLISGEVVAREILKR